MTNIEDLKQLAEAGQANAMLALANRYAAGKLGAERNLALAVEWWKKAAETNDKMVSKEACRRLVANFLDRDIEVALAYANRKARWGDESDLVTVAEAMLQGKMYSHKEKQKKREARMKAFDLLYEMQRWGNLQAKEIIQRELDLASDEEWSDKVRAYRDEEQVRYKTSPEYKEALLGIKISLIVLLSFWACFVGGVVYLKGKPHVYAVFPGGRVESVSSYGEVTVTDEDGKSLRLTDLKMFSEYIYNGTDSCLVLRNLCYAGNRHPSDYIPQRYEIQPHRLMKVVHRAEFFFSYPQRYAPPSGGRKHILIALCELLWDWLFSKDWYEVWFVDRVE